MNKLNEEKLKEFANSEDKEEYKRENKVTEDDVSSSFTSGFQGSCYQTPREYLDSLYGR